MKSSVSGMNAAAVTLAAALSLSVVGPHRAYAAVGNIASQPDSNLAVTVLSPTPRATFSGIKPVEVSAFYQGSAANQIVSVELYVDGAKAAAKTLEAPETRGVISFLIDAAALPSGTHRIVIRAVAVDAEVVSAKSSFIFVAPAADPVPNGDAPINPTVTNSAPELSFNSVPLDSHGAVSGTVKLSMEAHDASGKAPYVSLFIDHAFKTLRNYAPYEFEWDTTQYTNGYHTVEAYGYNDAQNVGHTKTIRLYVNNAGGRTDVRTDLKDAPATPAAKPTKSYRKPTFTAAKPLPPAKSVVVKVATQTPKPANKLIAGTPQTIGKLDPISTSNGLSSPFVHSDIASAAPAPAPLKVTGKPSRKSVKAAVASAPVHVKDQEIDQPVLMARGNTLSSDPSSYDITPELSNPFVVAAPTVKHPVTAPTTTATATPQPKPDSTSTPMLVARAGTNSATSSGVGAQPPVERPFVSGVPSTPVATPKATPATPVQAIAPETVKPIMLNHDNGLTTPQGTLKGGTSVVSPYVPGTPYVQAPQPEASLASEDVNIAVSRPLPPMLIERKSSATLALTSVNATPQLARPYVPGAQTMRPVAQTHAAPVAPVVQTKAPVMPVAPAIQAKVPVTPIAHPKAPATVVAAAPVVQAPKMARIKATTQGMARPQVLRLAKLGVQGEQLSSPFFVAPHVTHMTHTTVKVVSPTKRVGVHMASTNALSDLLRCKGQTAIMFNSTKLRLDRPLAAEGSIMFGPLRQIFEFQGGDLTWTAKTGTVNAKSETKDIVLQIGSRNASINHKTVALSAAPYLDEGRTMVPLSLLPAALDVNVQYDPSNGHLLITSKN